MIAIFLAPMTEDGANLVLPPLQSDDGLQLQYFDEKGVLRGGFSAIGGIPQTNVALVLVDTTAETVSAMVADGRWKFIEEVVGG